MPRPLVPGRRGLIIAAARHLLLKSGWPRTTIAGIAGHAGIGKGAVYLEFPDKPAILDAVLLAATRDMTAGVHERILEAPSDVDLATVYRFGVEALLDEPVMRALYLGDEAVLGEHVRTVSDQRYLQREEWLVDYIRDLQEAGALEASVPADTIARMLSTFTVGVIHSPATLGGGSPADLAGVIQAFAATTVQALATSTAVDTERERAAHLTFIERLERQLDLLEDPR